MCLRFTLCLLRGDDVSAALGVLLHREKAQTLSVLEKLRKGLVAVIGLVEVRLFALHRLLDHRAPDDVVVLAHQRLKRVEHQALVRENYDVIWGSMIKQTMQRKQPYFNESYYGYKSFSELLEDAQRLGLLSMKKDAKSGGYIISP